MSTRYDVVSLMPADGRWFAMFEHGEAEPVVAWGICTVRFDEDDKGEWSTDHDKDYREVLALIVDAESGDMLVPAGTARGFVGLTRRVA